MNDNELIDVLVESVPGWKRADPTGMSNLVKWVDTRTGVVMMSNPLEDLNAMHEAWRTLPKEKRIDFWTNLQEVCARNIPHMFKPADFDTGNATARQRAEAFIKTVCPEKWKE
jgi:hypothetical protein